MSNTYGFGGGYGGYGGYGAPTNPAQLRAALAAKMLAEGSSSEPIRSPWQGAARLGQAFTGALLARQGMNGWRQGQAQAAGLYGGAGGPPGGGMPGAPNGGSMAITPGAQPNPAASVSTGAPVPTGGNVPLPPPRPSGAPDGMQLASGPSLGAPTGIAQAPPVQTASLDPSSGIGSLLGPNGPQPPGGITGSLGATMGGGGANPFAPKPPGPPGQPPFMEAPQPGPEVAAADLNPADHAAFIRQYAAERGVDPNLALGIAGAEGLHALSPGNPNSASTVDRERDGTPFSYGDFQLNVHPGAVGDAAMKAGIDPRDPAEWQQADKFAIDYMADHGVSAWKGDPVAARALNGGTQVAAGDGFQGLPPPPPQGGGGFNRDAALSIIQNPYADPALRESAMQMLQYYSMPQFQMVQRPDGSAVEVDLRHPGAVYPIMGPMSKTQFGEIGEDPMTGAKKFGFSNPVTETVQPYNAPGSAGAGTTVPSPMTGAPVPAPPPQQPPIAPPQPVQPPPAAAGAPQPPMPPQGAGGPPMPAPQAAAPQQYPTQQAFESGIDQKLAAIQPQLVQRFGPDNAALMTRMARSFVMGQQQIPQNNAQAKPVELQAMDIAKQVDSTFTQNRFDTIKQFNEGTNVNTPGGMINAGRTAIGHLRDAAQLSEQMAQKQTDNPWFNIGGFANEFNNMGQKDTEAAYDSAIRKANEELTKFYLGAEGSKDERMEAIQNELSAASTPSQRRAAIQELAKLVESKTNALQERYHNGVGAMPDYQIETPDMKAQLGQIAGMGANAMPEPKSKADRDALPPGARYRAPDGSIRVR